MKLSIFNKRAVSILVFTFIFFLGVFAAVPVGAKDPDPKIQDRGFKAQYVSQSEQDPIKIEAGNTKQVTVKFKNIGSKTWNSNARNFISAYTVQSRYRASEFSSGQWISKKQTAKLSGVVRPGEIGDLEIKLTAPEKIGDYKEEFYLASENHSWVDNGYFYLDIKVIPKSRETTKKEKNTEDPDPNVRLPSYKAKYISQSESDPINMKVGETKDVTVKFKNTGSKIWKVRGPNFVSAYTMKPRYNESEFSGESWISSKQTGKFSSDVKPGETGSLNIKLNAPNKTGTYVEHFYLASENNTWIEDGYFYLKINVENNDDEAKENNSEVSGASEESKNKSENDKSSITNDLYKGKILLQSKTKVEAKGGKRIRLILGGKNTGKEKWDNLRITTVGPEASFGDRTWESASVVVDETDVTPAGSIFRKNIYFRAPPNEGEYELKLKFSSDNKKISGINISIPVKVTEDAFDSYKPYFTEEESDQVFRMEKEPWIKVGLKKVEEKYINFIPINDEYEVYSGEEYYGTVEEGDSVTVRINKGRYDAFSRQANIDVESDRYISFVPKDNKSAKFKLGNFERSVPWRNRNFNIYRGGFEYRYTKDKEDIYAINKVLLEDYVKGIGETSENPPIDFQKAQAVVSRTYAEYIKNTTKHNKRNFDVVANTGDQLYLGVISEEYSPIYVQASKETGGYMVTYDNDIAVTPYFGHSNGYTKGWHQVWGGSVKPWLVSVRAEYDQGLSEYGHGVGMSQRDAAIRADKEGSSWKELLHHYYTDIKLEKFYE